MTDSPSPRKGRRLNPVRVPIFEEPPAERACEAVEVLRPYTADEAIAEAARCISCAKPWCVEACPIAQDCREYAVAIAESNFDRAAGIVLHDNPLASTLARVCYHYCEEACVIAKKGTPVAIRHLKRAALDFGDSKRAYIRERSRDGRVAVLGAGPAGLMAAWVLARKGYRVTVFEAREMIGGLVTLTIPPYRLPREAFEEDIARMRQLGIEFRLGVRLGRDLTLEGLRRSHDAVFLGIGTHRPQSIALPGSDLAGVFLALRFLEDAVLGRQVRVGERVAVVGGGDVAMDSARMALRLGANEVTVVYRRSRQEMPASPEEVVEAEAEGVRIEFLVAPVWVEGDGRHVRRLACQRMELGALDETGRRRPVPVPNSEFSIPADAVILAIGQAADLSCIPDAGALGVRLGGDGVIVGLDDSGRTHLENVFVGGGISVVHAMAAGKRAAEAIHVRLSMSVPA